MRKPVFLWNEWNLLHIGQHHVYRSEAEHVVRHPHAGYPRPLAERKHQSRGTTNDGRFLQVIFVYRDSATIDIAGVDLCDLVELEEAKEVVYVIHARDLNEQEKRKLRRHR